MTATVFYDNINEVALLSNTFTNAAGLPADPLTVVCIVTEPSGAAVTHTYLGAIPPDVTKVSTGKYSLAVPCSPSEAGVDGLWGYEWVGTGTVSDVQPGTWRVLPENVSQLWYVGLEEMKGRLGIFDSAEDYELQTAIAASTGWMNDYYGTALQPGDGDPHLPAGQHLAARHGRHRARHHLHGPGRPGRRRRLRGPLDPGHRLRAPPRPGQLQRRTRPALPGPTGSCRSPGASGCRSPGRSPGWTACRSRPRGAGPRSPGRSPRPAGSWRQTNSR